MTRLRQLTTLAALTRVLLCSEAFAQDAERPAPAEARPTPEALQGPLAPSIASAIVGLDEGQLVRYVAAYRTHMTSTWDTRWGVASALRLLEEAHRSGDPAAVRHYHSVMEQLWTRVSAKDQSFELGLESFLREKQLRRYREWREAWEGAIEIQRRIDARNAPAVSRAG